MDRAWWHSLQKRVMLQVRPDSAGGGLLRNTLPTAAGLRPAWRRLPALGFPSNTVALTPVHPSPTLPQDWSWNKPAHTYIELYHAAKGQ